MILRLSASVTFIISCFTASFVAGQQTILWDEAYLVKFSYDTGTEEGPNDWDNVNTDATEYNMYTTNHGIFDLGVGENECDKEIRPSPISLQLNDKCPDDHDIRTRRITSQDCTRDDITFEITPHVLRAYYPLNDRSCRRPTIRIDGANDDAFVLVWMELHGRSEHVVDGKRYDAELQMVHMGTANSDDELTNISILIDSTAEKDNVDFQYLLNQWQDVADGEKVRCETRRVNRKLRENVHKRVNTNAAEKKRQQRETTASNFVADDTPDFHHRQTQAQICDEGQDDCAPRRKMYPYSLWPSIWYFRYSGSLTTPPCSSIVNWRIIDAPMFISRRQLKQMAALLTSYKGDNCDAESSVFLSPQGENFRPLQKRSNRQRVSHCTDDNFGVSLYAPRNQ